MNTSAMIKILLSFTMFLLLSCGNSIKNAQDFIPNKAPFIDVNGIVLSDVDGNSYAINSVVVGLKIHCTVPVQDPEGKPLGYTFRSEYGSTSNLLVTDSGCTVDFLIEKAGRGEPIPLVFSAVDDKGASSVTNIDIGTGQTSVVLSVGKPLKKAISYGGNTSFSFSASGTGYYQIISSTADITDIDKAMTVLIKYPVIGKEVMISLFGPGITNASGDYTIFQLKRSGDNPTRVWVLFKDANNNFASDSIYVALDLIPPTVMSATPTGSGVLTDSVAVSVTFSEDMDPTSFENNLITSSGTYSCTFDSYDSTSFTAHYTLNSLDKNKTYTFTSAAKDVPGNTVVSPNSFTFTTAP
jgi:hypothetical protein